MNVIGRRLPDTLFGKIPEGIQPGDIWKCLGNDGEPMSARAHADGADESSPVHQNLTDTVWQFYSPDGNGIGTLVYHTVREHVNGTVSVIPGDGSSNSILHKGGNPEKSWHGYIDHNTWRPV